MKIAEEAAAYASRSRHICAVITLNVKNAFNSASWQEILAELKRREIDESLLKIISSYLSERKILLEAENKIKEKSVNSRRIEVMLTRFPMRGVGTKEGEGN